MLDKNVKEKIIKKFKAHENDTGSPQVQIAILTEEIKRLTDHLKSHKKDHSSRRGLLKKIGERRRLLKYLQKEDEGAFKNVTSKLNLRIAKKMEKEEELKRQLEEQLTTDGESKTDDEEDGEEGKDKDDKKNNTN
jgi:small subunit ribosomal protein S15